MPVQIAMNATIPIRGTTQIERRTSRRDACQAMKPFLPSIRWGAGTRRDSP